MILEKLRGRSGNVVQWNVGIIKGPNVQNSLPMSISTDVGKKLHLHKMILVIAGVNGRVLSVMP